MQKVTQDGKAKITKILGVSNPTELGTLKADQFEERWRGVTVTFVKDGQESRCVQKCKKSRDPILKFSLSMMQTKLTRSQNRTWSPDSIDGESSDAVKPEQLRDQVV